MFCNAPLVYMYNPFPPTWFNFSVNLILCEILQESQMKTDNQWGDLRDHESDIS